MQSRPDRAWGSDSDLVIRPEPDVEILSVSYLAIWSLLDLAILICFGSEICISARCKNQVFLRSGISIFIRCGIAIVFRSGILMLTRCGIAIYFRSGILICFRSGISILTRCGFAIRFRSGILICFKCGIFIVFRSSVVILKGGKSSSQFRWLQYPGS